MGKRYLILGDKKKLWLFPHSFITFMYYSICENY